MCCSDAPDTSGISRAAEANADIAREALSWYQKAYADQAPARAAAEQRANAVSDAQLGAMQFATDQAKELDAYNKTTFRPLEQQIVADSQTHDTQQRRMQEAAAAAARVDESAAGVQKANDMALARVGVDPGSARALMVREDTAGNQVRTRAGAMTDAIKAVEQQGYARKMDAAGLGRNLQTNQATQQQIASTTGNSSASNAGSALDAAMSGNATMGQGFNTSIAGNQSAGRLFSQAAQINQQSQDDMLKGITGLGMAAGQMGWKPFAPSDKTKKKNTGRMADTAKALAQVEDTPVEDGWQYDPAKGGPDDGGAEHIGPMAQSARKTMGEDAAPGGKVIDLVNMNGRMMAAVQELAKRVKAIERRAA